MTAVAVEPKRPRKLARLLAQLPDGRTVPAFVMPSADLQKELDAALDSWIKQHLKANGWELLRATRREHPGHSELVRQRIDALVELLGPNKDQRHAWAAAVGQWRAFLRDRTYWRGTYLDRVLNPPDEPPIPDQLPKPVYVGKYTDSVLALHDGVIDFWALPTS
jgi:hypothetical protein